MTGVPEERVCEYTPEKLLNCGLCEQGPSGRVQGATALKTLNAPGRLALSLSLLNQTLVLCLPFCKILGHQQHLREGPRCREEAGTRRVLAALK